MWWKSQSLWRHPKSLRPKLAVVTRSDSVNPWPRRQAERAANRKQKFGDSCKLFLVSSKLHALVQVTSNGIFPSYKLFLYCAEANARQQLLEHLGFHADTIAQAAMEYSEDVSKGVEHMSIGEKSLAPMVSLNPSARDLQDAATNHLVRTTDKDDRRCGEGCIDCWQL